MNVNEIKSFDRSTNQPTDNNNNILERIESHLAFLCFHGIENSLYILSIQIFSNSFIKMNIIG